MKSQRDFPNDSEGEYRKYLRTYFAGLAMNGILADGETSDIPSVAKASIMVADELLKQLDK